MKLEKKLAAVFLAAVLVLTMLAGCGAGGTDLVQPDIQKGREIAASLNAARADANQTEAVFDEALTRQLTAYANQYVEYKLLINAYWADQTEENQAKAMQAQTDLRKAEQELADQLDGQVVLNTVRKDEFDVAEYDEAKAAGQNIFADTTLAKRDADFCSITVVSKQDLTYAVMLLGKKA